MPARMSCRNPGLLKELVLVPGDAVVEVGAGAPDVLPVLQGAPGHGARVCDPDITPKSMSFKAMASPTHAVHSDLDACLELLARVKRAWLSDISTDVERVDTILGAEDWTDCFWWWRLS